MSSFAVMLLANKLLGDDVVSKTQETIPEFLRQIGPKFPYIRGDLWLYWYVRSSQLPYTTIYCFDRLGGSLLTSDVGIDDPYRP
jgi:hypothetical protein